jgi:hypothetical protein
MRNSISILFGSLLIGACVAVVSPVAAQEAAVPPEAEVEREQSWYREQQISKADTRAIIIEKAQVRAYQRQERLASMSWYGMSNSRPRGACTPFTSRYSSVWEMPGGRPYSWYPQSRPGYVMYWR